MLITQLYLVPRVKNGAVPGQEGQRTKSTVVPVKTVTDIPLELNHFELGLAID